MPELAAMPLSAQYSLCNDDTVSSRKRTGRLSLLSSLGGMDARGRFLETEKPDLVELASSRAAAKLLDLACRSQCRCSRMRKSRARLAVSHEVASSSSARKH